MKLRIEERIIKKELKWKIILLMVIIFLIGVPKIILATEQDNKVTYGNTEYYYYKIENNEVTILRTYYIPSGDHIIPEKIEGYPVTEIGTRAFSLDDMNSVRIPYTIKRIGDNPFVECSELERIDVDINNPNYISINGILFNKEKTEIIRYPPKKEGIIYTIPSTVTSINCMAFGECKNLSKINIPDSVTRIGNQAFVGTTFETLDIPNSVVSIGRQAFTVSALKEIYLPDSITSIEDRAFEACRSLKRIRLPNNLTIIEERII